MTALSGYKTYLGVVGGFCLAIYQLTQGQFDNAALTFIAAWTAAGLRHAVSKGPAKEAGPALDVAKLIKQVGGF